MTLSPQAFGETFGTTTVMIAASVSSEFISILFPTGCSVPDSFKVGWWHIIFFNFTRYEFDTVTLFFIIIISHLKAFLTLVARVSMLTIIFFICLQCKQTRINGKSVQFQLWWEKSSSDFAKPMHDFFPFFHRGPNLCWTQWVGEAVLSTAGFRVANVI